jgi:hypothetical protein
VLASGINDDDDDHNIINNINSIQQRVTIIVGVQYSS